ncbi:MAG: hypothetical protein R3E39_23550 [Anaerolineae bacterium]
MSPINVVTNEYVTLQYLPDKKMLYHTVHKPVNEEAFKSALNAGVEMLGKNGIVKWLSDDRKNGPFSDAFSAWVITDWIPRAIDTGWRYWANVVPEDLKAAGTLMPFIEILHDKGLRMMVFSNTDEAVQWLEQN